MKATAQDYAEQDRKIAVLYKEKAQISQALTEVLALDGLRGDGHSDARKVEMLRDMVLSLKEQLRQRKEARHYEREVRKLKEQHELLTHHSSSTRKDTAGSRSPNHAKSLRKRKNSSSSGATVPVERHLQAHSIAATTQVTCRADDRVGETSLREALGQPNLTSPKMHMSELRATSPFISQTVCQQTASASASFGLFGSMDQTQSKMH